MGSRGMLPLVTCSAGLLPDGEEGGLPYIPPPCAYADYRLDDSGLRLYLRITFSPGWDGGGSFRLQARYNLPRRWFIGCPPDFTSPPPPHYPRRRAYTTPTHTFYSYPRRLYAGGDCLPAYLFHIGAQLLVGRQVRWRSIPCATQLPRLFLHLPSLPWRFLAFG